MKHLDLFSGIGGFALAARYAGLETVVFCEKDPFCQTVLKKHWKGVPIYDDVKCITNEHVRGFGRIDLLTGGVPCQPFSVAGKQKARRMTATSGRKCLELLHKSDRLGSLSKTLLVSLQWNSTIQLLTWKAKGTPQGRLLFQLAPSTPPIDETASGSSQNLWQTPTATQISRTPEGIQKRTEFRKSIGRKSYAAGCLEEQVALFPTPRAALTGHITPERKNDKYRNLEKVVAEQVFPTSLSTCEHGAGRQGGKNLQTVTAEQTPGGLNPNWVEALMGYPPDWTLIGG